MRKKLKSILAILLMGGIGLSAFILIYQVGFGWRDTFLVDKGNLGLVGSNPYFNLTPGYRLTLGDGDTKIILTVLDENKTIDSVVTRVVEDREEEGGVLVEITRDYFAIDKTTNDVYYFGEDVDEYEGGVVTGHGGSWLSGTGGAKFGLMIPGEIERGDKFYQEQAPGVAMDRAEVVGITESLTTPLGTFTNCIHFRESSAIEWFAVGDKWYAPDVGMVKDDNLVLTKIG